MSGSQKNLAFHGRPVEGISEALSYELEAIGVTVKLVEPGFVRTDFGGKSFDFNNNEQLSEYQALVKKLFAGMREALAKGSEASLVAETIYKAAEDRSSQLRYVAGADAEALLAQRGKEGEKHVPRLPDSLELIRMARSRLDRQEPIFSQPEGLQMR